MQYLHYLNLDNIVPRPMSPVEYYDYISFIIQLFSPCDKNSYFFLTGLVSVPIVNFPTSSVHFCTFKPINQTEVIYQFFLFFPGALGLGVLCPLLSLVWLFKGPGAQLLSSWEFPLPLLPDPLFLKSFMSLLV